MGENGALMEELTVKDGRVVDAYQFVKSPMPPRRKRFSEAFCRLFGYFMLQRQLAILKGVCIPFGVIQTFWRKSD